MALREKMKLLKNWRILLLITFLIISAIAIKPNLDPTGVTIRSVAPNTAANDAGILNPEPNIKPVNRERILNINGEEINSIENYYDFTQNLVPNQTVHIKTNQALYRLATKAMYENDTIVGTENLGIKIGTVPGSNIKKGLDLEGGSRVMLAPEEPITEDQLGQAVANINERLNIYGLGDVVVRSAGDLSGGQFIVIEIAGVTEEEIVQLVTQQGKFEAKIQNKTIFSGGSKDITYVCKNDASCSGINPSRGCGQTTNGWFCNFFFTIALSQESAKRQADTTRELDVITEDGQSYVSEDLDLYLDDILVTSLRIGAELKGRETTQIQISGGEQGSSRQEAQENALKEMERLQTVLITGSLPVKMRVVKTETVSPILGKQFLNNALLIGALAFLAVGTVVYVKYRRLKIVVPMIITLACELVLILGAAAILGWNLDLAAIAGIIITIGTGVDHLIIITDEISQQKEFLNWKTRLKRAMFVVIGAYLTNIVAMIPLGWAGAGILRGFAITTVAGMTLGVFVARPAYAVIIKHLTE